MWRREATQDDVVLEIELQGLEGLVRLETVESHDHVLLSHLPNRLRRWRSHYNYK